MIQPSIIADLDFEKRWQEGIKNWSGQIPERMTDDDLEESFWRGLLNEKKPGQIDDYSHPLRLAILSSIDKEDSVLEIGPGWGNYTFALLEHAKSLSIADPSQAVLDFLSQQADKGTLNTYRTKWEEFHSSERYDVIVGVNCFYRMFEIKQALLNMNHYAEKLCIVGMTTGSLPPHYYDLEKEYGYQVKHPRRDYIDLQYLLYECGIQADCKIVPLTRAPIFSTMEEAVKKGSSKVFSPEVNPAHVEAVLQPYLKKIPEGYQYEQSFYGALLSWKPITR